LCYKCLVFTVLLFLSIGLFAGKDPYLHILPKQTVKAGKNRYKSTKYTFKETVSKLKKSFVKKEYIKSDFLIKEGGFQIYVFYNLKSTSKWHKIYVIEEEGKVFIRVFE